MSDLLDTHFRFTSAALSLRAERQKLLASNIANADTPNYKARDIDFGKALQQAVTASAASATSSATAASMHVSHPHHLQTSLHASASLLASGAQPMYRIPHQDSIDGNTVELDAERAQFADNALRYEAALSEVNGKIKSLSTVLQGQ